MSNSYFVIEIFSSVMMREAYCDCGKTPISLEALFKIY